MKKTILLSLLSSILLSACGGGGADSVANTASNVNNNPVQPATTPLPAPTLKPATNVLRSSEGDLSHYVGTWMTGCVSKMVGLDFHGVSGVLKITSTVNNQSVQAVQTESDYGKGNWDCKGQPINIVPTEFNLNIKIVAKVPVTGSAFTGYADQAVVSVAGGKDVNLYYAFDDSYQNLRMSTDANISAISAVYKKFK